MSEFGDLIRKKREAAGLTPTELSFESRVPEQNIRNWESGKRRCNKPEQLLRLCNALGIDMAELSAASGAPKSKPKKRRRARKV